jgi:hypothetical protein
MALNTDLAPRILMGLRRYYRFPKETFVGTPESVDALKHALSQEGRKE